MDWSSNHKGLCSLEFQDPLFPRPAAVLSFLRAGSRNFTYSRLSKAANVSSVLGGSSPLQAPCRKQVSSASSFLPFPKDKYTGHFFKLLLITTGKQRKATITNTRKSLVITRLKKSYRFLYSSITENVTESQSSLLPHILFSLYS